MKRKISDISVVKENNILNLYYLSDDVYDEYYNLSKISKKSKDSGIIGMSNYIPNDPHAIYFLEYQCRPKINWDVFGRNVNSARNMFQKCRDEADNE